MTRVGVIALCGPPFQDLFWGSYLRCNASYPHDLIVVHRNGLGLPYSITSFFDHGWPHSKDTYSLIAKGIISVSGSISGTSNVAALTHAHTMCQSIILENKIIGNDDVPHRAFGAYRYYFEKYSLDYDLLVFVSDDVILKRDGWLKDIVHTMNKHERIGFGASHIFLNKGYPHPNHCRAPFWWAKTEALRSIQWEFDHDHDGELKTGDLLSNAGWIGVQVGNKINLGYDALEHHHIIAMVEKQFSPDTFPYGKIETDHFQCFLDALKSHHPDPFHIPPFDDYNVCVWCEDPGIYSRNIFTQLFCFDQLVYDGVSTKVAKDHGIVDEYDYGICILNI